MQKTIEKPGIVMVVVSSGILVGLLFFRQAAVEDQVHSLNAGVGGTSAQIVGLLDEKTPTTVTSRVRPLSAQTEMPSATQRLGSESTSSEAPENELDKKDVSAHDQNRVYILRNVQPIYPTRALERGIEGYVLLEFTVTEAGIAIDRTVVESDPTGIFDRAALVALSEFKYQPRVVDGEPVRTEGVRHRIDFEIEDDSTTRTAADLGGQSVYVPMRKVSATYPERALQRGIEGYVVLEFTVNETGSVVDPVVVESEPAGIFDRAALAALSEFKYQPRVIDDVPVRLEGVRHRIDFEIEDDSTTTTDLGGQSVYVPMRKVPATYPDRALQRGIEGYVVLEFTVNETGSVVDSVVVESEPAGIFDRSAIQAASKFNYRPRVDDGKSVRTEGVRHRFEYKLEGEIPWSRAVVIGEHPDDTESYDGYGEYLPIHKVRPIYPERALQRGIEGYVVLEFIVDEVGEVIDPVVVESEPTGIFDRAAIQASSKFKYQPRVVDGEVVRVEGVKLRIEFDIEHAD